MGEHTQMHTANRMKTHLQPTDMLLPRCVFCCLCSTLAGYNTDWLGIRDVLRARLSCSIPRVQDVALVLGAGGTARAAIYALGRMGFHQNNIVIFNPRTKENAHKLAKEFGVKGQPADRGSDA